MIGTVYRSPNSYETKFLEKFCYFSKDKENDAVAFCVLLGDLNFDLLRPAESINAEYINVLKNMYTPQQ